MKVRHVHVCYYKKKLEEMDTKINTITFFYTY